MSAVPLFAVAAVDGSGLHDLTDATVQDGYISFTVDRMGSYAILGFAEEGQTKPKNDIPVPLLIIIIVGVLLLVAAGLLLFFFVLRRPRDPDDDLPAGRRSFLRRRLAHRRRPDHAGPTPLPPAISRRTGSRGCSRRHSAAGSSERRRAARRSAEANRPFHPCATGGKDGEERSGWRGTTGISTVRTASVPPLPPPMFPSAPLRSRKGRKRRIPATTISTCRHGTAFGKPASASSAPVTVGQPGVSFGIRRLSFLRGSTTDRAGG